MRGVALAPVREGSPAEAFSEASGSAVDLVRGLGKLADIEVVDVPGITAWYVYTEAATAASAPVPNHTLMARLVSRRVT